MTAKSFLSPLFLYLILTLNISNLLAQQQISLEKIQTAREQFLKQDMEKWRQLMKLDYRPKQTQNDFDAEFYQLDLRVDFNPNNFSATARGRFRSLVDGLNYIVLDFDEIFTIESITGDVAGYKLSSETFEIILSRAFNAGETFEISTSYHGIPRLLNGIKAFNFREHNGVPMAVTLSTPYLAHLWWPCKDGPQDKPDSVDINITIPDVQYNSYEFYAASNGKLVNMITNSDNTKTFKWQVRYPIPVYYVGIAVTNYRIFTHWYNYSPTNSMPVHYYVFPEHYDEAVAGCAQTVNMVEFLSEKFGQYPFINEKYAMSEIGFYGGIENQTNTVMGSLSPDWEMVILHELSHQWFADMITCKNWHHGWVNEGFATYCEALYWEYLYGNEAYHQYMNFLTYLGGGTLYLQDVSDPFNVFISIIYNKGAWVLHMLRGVLGDSLFFDIMKSYATDPRFMYKNAGTEDFQSVCEEKYGNSLEWFFHQWVCEPGHPIYAFTSEASDLGNGQYKIEILVEQAQIEGPIFKMPMDITLVMDDTEVTLPVIVDEKTEIFEFMVNAAPQRVILDKDDWILKEVREITAPAIAFVDYTIDDSQGNGNGRPDPGENIQLVINLNNTGKSAKNVIVELQTFSSDISIISHTINFGTIGINNMVNNETNPFSFSISPDAKTDLFPFSLNITADENYSTADYFFVGNILLVDDDAGADYEQYVMSQLNQARIRNTCWETKISGLPFDTLSSFNTMVWFTGDDRDSTLTPEEQSLIADFLNAGGRLLISGQNIGYDLVENGSENDSIFFNNYLQAQYIADNVDQTMLIGVPGDPITQGLFLNFSGDYSGAGNQTSPDVIAPIDQAAALLKYIPSMEGAGLRHFDTTNGSYLIYLPYGIEGIAGPYRDSAEKFIRNCMAWISGATAVKEDIVTPEIPTKFILEQNYPNPFNAMTQIRYHLPEACKVKLIIFNLMGQKVCTLVDEIKQIGVHQVSWAGMDELEHYVSSGIYFYRLETKKFSITRKMILLF
jgi:hypothetical protein